MDDNSEKSVIEPNLNQNKILHKRCLIEIFSTHIHKFLNDTCSTLINDVIGGNPPQIKVQINQLIFNTKGLIT